MSTTRQWTAALVCLMLGACSESVPSIDGTSSNKVRKADNQTAKPQAKDTSPTEESQPEATGPSTGATFDESNWNLTFRHLDLNTVGLDEEGMNFGLAKALNSISQVSEVVPIEPLEGGLSYSIDPDMFGFSQAQKQATESCQQMRTTQVDGQQFWEADSFMYCVLEPRIYYQMMNIAGAGNMETTTESLYLNTERTADNHQIYGASTSPVANGADRLIERIERPDGGTYWGTGDFLRADSLANALETGVFPAQNAGRVGQLKAGEFMWEMDNGFIGYALSGFAAQARYEANINVASDQARGDGLVIAGYGCMSCHAKGFNTGQFLQVGQGDPNATYPNEEEVAALVERDNKRFLDAMRKLGYSDETLLGPEPITAIVTNFEQRTNTQFVEGGALGATGN